MLFSSLLLNYFLVSAESILNLLAANLARYLDEAENFLAVMFKPGRRTSITFMGALFFDGTTATEGKKSTEGGGRKRAETRTSANLVLAPDSFLFLD